MTARPLDADRPTLHIRCGSDIRDTLRAGGFIGDFLEYSDPVCEGPVPDVPDLVAVRARYLSGAYGAALGLTEAMLADRLRDEDARLSAAHRYDRVVLWFEHDSYDQLLLARCLSRLAETRLPACLELICIDSHPDVPRFTGLGRLNAAALAGLWPGRRPVGAEQIAMGQAIWAALRLSDPSGLQAIARTGTPALPVAAPALWRHLRELPDLVAGLSLTQRLTLMLLAERGATRVGELFAAMVGGREPLVFMGDLGFLNTMEAMARTEPPVLVIGPAEKQSLRQAWLTNDGQRVLSGVVDYLSLNPDERWVGGVDVRHSGWRFDEAQGCIVMQDI